MKKLWGALRGIFTVLLALVLLANLWLLAARLLLHQDLPKLFGFSQATVLSGSMEPAFSAGDMLVFRQKASYGSGDVVIFRQGGSFVTHRIVGAENGAFVTKGDANNTPDTEPLDPAAIEGALALVLPGIGGALAFLRTPLGILILTLICLALIEAPHLRALFWRR